MAALQRDKKLINAWAFMIGPTQFIVLLLPQYFHLLWICDEWNNGMFILGSEFNNSSLLCLFFIFLIFG
jgi:hypothetical protein